MERKISFGKIDFDEVGKACNEVEIRLSLEEKEKGLCFSASGAVWNRRNTDWLTGGQCLDTILPFLKHNELYREIYRLWDLYHLNDMNAGTIEQERALEEAIQNGELKSYGANNYTETCEYLKYIGLYEVEYNGKPYKYGHAWLYREIPEEDLELIKSIIKYGTLED